MSTEPNSPFVDDPLSAVDARISATSSRKQATTRETYPLTLNALVSPATRDSRDPGDEPRPARSAEPAPARGRSLWSGW